MPINNPPSSDGGGVTDGQPVFTDGPILSSTSGGKGLFAAGAISIGDNSGSLASIDETGNLVAATLAGNGSAITDLSAAPALYQNQSAGTSTISPDSNTGNWILGGTVSNPGIYSKDGLTYFDNSGFHGDGSALTNLPGGGGVAGVRTFADATAQAAATPDFVGQLAMQVDTNVLSKSYGVGTGTFGDSVIVAETFALLSSDQTNTFSFRNTGMFGSNGVPIGSPGGAHFFDDGGFFGSVNVFGDEQSSGVLTVGAHYRIQTITGTDDFTNVGASNNSVGVTFTATGTTPTEWDNLSTLRPFSGGAIGADTGWTANADAGDKTAVIGSTATLDGIATALNLVTAGAGTQLENIAQKVKALEAALANQTRPNN